MRLNLLFPSLFLCVFAISCGRVDQVNHFQSDIRIVSRVSQAPAGTRGTAYEEHLPDQSCFGLYGYCVPYQQELDQGEYVPDYSAGTTSWAIKKNFAHADVFCNQKISVHTNSSCTYEPVQQWYSDYSIANTVHFKYSFFAYYPYTVTDALPKEKTAIALPVVSYSMPFTSSRADVLLDESKTDDLMYACTVDTYKKDGVLSLKFNHAMTGIHLKMISFNKMKTVKITRAELICERFFKSVSLHLYEYRNAERFMSFTDERYSGKFNLLDAEEVLLEVAADQDKVEYDSTKNILLLSNQKSSNSLGDNASLYLEMEVTDKETSAVNTVRFDGYRFPDNFRAHPGIGYVLEINYVDKDFVINIIAKNSEVWENGGDSDSELN